MSKGRHIHKAKKANPSADLAARLAAAVPHGPDEPCTCSGCWACTGHVTGCTCDIDWAAAAEARLDQ